jgi:hypothetical protein
MELSNYLKNTLPFFNELGKIIEYRSAFTASAYRTMYSSLNSSTLLHHHEYAIESPSTTSFDTRPPIMVKRDQSKKSPSPKITKSRKRVFCFTETSS